MSTTWTRCFVRFDNGVRLTVKPTKFRDDQILVMARFGHGRLDLPSDHQTPPGPRPAASPRAVSTRSSPRTSTRRCAREILGRTFGVGDDAFVLSGGDPPGGPRHPAAAAGRLCRPSRLAAGGVPADEVARADPARPVRGHATRACSPATSAACCTPATAAGASRSRGEIGAETPADLKALLAGPARQGPDRGGHRRRHHRRQGDRSGGRHLRRAARRATRRP